MPAQMFLSQSQLQTMAELGHDVVVTEGPGAQEAQALDVWVMDEESLRSNTHRSVVIDVEGEVLSDTQMSDDH